MTLSLRVEQLFVILRRDVKQRLSYKMSALFSLVGGVSGLLIYGLLGQSALTSVTSQSYGMSLTGYLVSGVAFSAIITNGPGMFVQYARASQIEEILVTPTSFHEYLLLSSVLGIITGLGNAFGTFGVSILLFGLSYSYNLSALLIVTVLGVLCSIGLGLIGLGFQLVYKQATILSWILFTLTGIVGNMLVPVQIFPSFVQIISYFVPQYYFFTVVRVALGSNVASLFPLLGIFALYTGLLLLAGFVALKRGMRSIRRSGSHRWT